MYSPCAISIYRIQTLHAAAVAKDPTWDNVGAATFSFLELAIGVVAVCLPTMRPLIAVTMPRLLGSLRSQKLSEKHSHAAGPDEFMPAAHRVVFSVGRGTSTLRGSGLEEIEDGKSLDVTRGRSNGSDPLTS
jgi:hypothetical protein